MEITLEQARALEAVARLGGFAKAAVELKKGHTGVIYLIKTLEDRLNLKLLDRSGYRARLTPTGSLVLTECKKVLSAEQNLLQVCQDISQGWEPFLRLVFDGVVSIEGALKALARLEKQKVPTRVSLYSEFLGGVEQKFTDSHADIMVSVLPPEHLHLASIELPKLRALLVANSEHPLVRGRKPFLESQMQEHVLLTVRGSDERLKLSTRGLDRNSLVQLSDFHTKKSAILGGLGFGWLPEYLIVNELKRKALRVVKWEGSSEHWYSPRLYHRGDRFLGRAGKFFVEQIIQEMETSHNPKLRPN